jgi:hypothetical protein
VRIAFGIRLLQTSNPRKDKQMTRDEKESLATNLVSLYLDAGFGAPSKREVDLLLFHHITRARENRKKSNYELASLLKIPESRVKSYRLASALKYQEINSKAILGEVILRLSKGIQSTALEAGKFELSLEDPIERRELENYLKSKGHFAEYTFNSEVVRIAPVRLFELIVENMDNAEETFNELVRQHIEDADTSDRILEGAPTLKQKFHRLRKEVMSSRTLISLVAGAASAFGV